MARKDLTGQKFNHLTVLKLDEERSNKKRTYWICQCDCENKTIKSIRSDGLTSGHTKSCGCENRRLAAERMKIWGSNSEVKQDLTGQTFGYWTVIDRAENQNGHVAWNCICKCGTKRAVLRTFVKYLCKLKPICFMQNPKRDAPDNNDIQIVVY